MSRPIPAGAMLCDHLAPVHISYPCSDGQVVHAYGVLEEDWVFTPAFPYFCSLTVDEVDDLKSDLDMSQTSNLFGRSSAMVSFYNSCTKNEVVYEGYVQYGWKIDGIAEELEDFFTSMTPSSLASTDVPSWSEAAYFLAIKLSNLHFLDIMSAVHRLQMQSMPFQDMRQGQQITVITNPFNGRSPSNYWYSSVVSNIVGSKSPLIIVDYRYTLSCEGSPFYVNSFQVLMGILLCPIMYNDQISSYSIGVSSFELGLTLSNALLSLGSSYRFDTWRSTAVEHPSLGADWQRILVENGIFQSIVLVSLTNSWGTGVVVEGGYIITNSHVVNHGRVQDPIKVYFGGFFHLASLVFYTSEGNEVDFAVLEFARNMNFRPLIFSPTPPVYGEEVLAIGFSVFRSNYPNVSKGIVSNISHLIFSTCSIHGGMSGGALIRADGTLLGLISCSIGSGNSIASLNAAVNVETFRSPMLHFAVNRDLNILQSLIETKGRRFPRTLGAKIYRVISLRLGVAG